MVKLQLKQTIIREGGTECWIIRKAIGTSDEERQQMLQGILQETELASDVITMYGKTFVIARQVGIYSDNGLAYDYTGNRINGQIWGPTVSKIKKQVEKLTNETYNFCVVNMYPDGKSSIGWHFDKVKNNPAIGSPITSVTFGASRDFQIRARDYLKSKLGSGILYTIKLDAGDLLLMGGTMQKRYKHCVPKRMKVNDVRVNLTFRNVISPEI